MAAPLVMFMFRPAHHDIFVCHPEPVEGCIVALTKSSFLLQFRDPRIVVEGLRILQGVLILNGLPFYHLLH